VKLPQPSVSQPTALFKNFAVVMVLPTTSQTHPEKELLMPAVLRDCAKSKNGDLVLVGTMTAPDRNDMNPRERQDKRSLIRRGATIFKKEIARHPKS
jgi:Tfp pilus assembly ATPase PilU